MKVVRLTTRTLVFGGNKLLLVKNSDADFWYPPGGGMEDTDKNLPECAAREVLEETGLEVEITSLAWTREFFDEKKQRLDLETYWVAKPKGDGKLNSKHVDMDETGEVEHVGWFTEQEVQNMTIYPKIIRTLNFKKTQGLESRYLTN